MGSKVRLLISLEDPIKRNHVDSCGGAAKRQLERETLYCSSLLLSLVQERGLLAAAAAARLYLTFLEKAVEEAASARERGRR